MVPLKHTILESAIEAELKWRVEAAGGVCEKVKVIGRRGFFDRLVLLPGGRVIFVETKRPRGGVWAIHQRKYAEHYRALGAEVALVRKPADIDALLKTKRPKRFTTLRPKSMIPPRLPTDRKEPQQ